MLKIDELEEQCSEINREKERNTQLKQRIEELESEVREKETVSGPEGPSMPGTRQVSGEHVTCLAAAWASAGDRPELHRGTNAQSTGPTLPCAAPTPAVSPGHGSNPWGSWTLTKHSETVTGDLRSGSWGGGGRGWQDS